METLLLNIVEYKSEKESERVECEADIMTFYSGLREIATVMFPPTDF